MGYPNLMTTLYKFEGCVDEDLSGVGIYTVSKTLEITSGEIEAGGSHTTDAIDVSNLTGKGSLQWEITGSGTAKFEVLTSNDGTTFFDIDTDIAAEKTAGTGMAAFDFTICQSLKIQITETGSTDPVSVTADLKLQ
jgi:hypothetical protein